MPPANLSEPKNTPSAVPLETRVIVMESWAIDEPYTQRVSGICIRFIIALPVTAELLYNVPLYSPTLRVSTVIDTLKTLPDEEPSEFDRSDVR